MEKEKNIRRKSEIPEDNTSWRRWFCCQDKVVMLGWRLYEDTLLVTCPIELVFFWHNMIRRCLRQILEPLVCLAMDNSCSVIFFSLLLFFSNNIFFCVIWYDYLFKVLRNLGMSISPQLSGFYAFQFVYHSNWERFY